MSYNANFLKNWQLKITDAAGATVLTFQSSTILSNDFAMEFFVYPFGGIGYPSAASFVLYNLTQTEESKFKEDLFVSFSVGLGTYSNNIFQGRLKAFFTTYKKPDYLFNMYCLGVNNDTQYDLTKKMITVDIQKSTIKVSAGVLASNLSVSSVKFFGIDPTTPTPPMKIVAENIYNAMDIYSDTVQISYSFDPIKNSLSIYPNHKISTQNFLTGAAPAVKILQNIIDVPSVDVGTQNMNCMHLITNQIIYFGDIIRLDLNVLNFTGLEQAPVQYLVTRNKNADFFVHTVFFAGDVRVSTESTWVQYIYGVSQN